MTSRERANNWFDTVYGYAENNREISRLALRLILDEHEAYVRAEEREACVQDALKLGAYYTADAIRERGAK